jgi:hypothetical protein
MQAMWLACETLDSIAASCGCNHQTVANVTEEFSKTVLENQNRKAASSHVTDFDPPLYNIWRQKEKKNGRIGNVAGTVQLRFRYVTETVR